MNWPKIQWFKARMEPDPNEAAVETQQGAGGYDLKRWLVLGGLVCLLVVAGVANYRLNDLGGDNPTTAENPAEFNTLEDWENAKMKTVVSDTSASDTTDSTVITTLSQFAMERDRVRAEEIATLDSVIDANTDEELVYEAQKQKLALTKSMETEVTLQGLLVAKGFEGAVVTVHPGNVNIVVHSEKLTEAQAARILDVAVRETGEPAGNIKIVPTKPAN